MSVLSFLVLDGFDRSHSEKENFVDAGETWLKHGYSGSWVPGVMVRHLS